MTGITCPCAAAISPLYPDGFKKWQVAVTGLRFLLESSERILIHIANLPLTTS